MAAAPKHGSRPGHTALTGLLVTRWGGAGDRCCGCYWLRDNSGGSPHWPGHHLQLQRKHQDGHQQASALHCTLSKGSHSPTVAASVLCFLPFPILKLFHFKFRIQFSFICHIRNNLLMVESPVSLLGVLGW